jgi:hypothetical protein
LAVPSLTDRRITITGARREQLDTAALARLLADLAAQSASEPPESHPTKHQPDPRASRKEKR